jgi:hypothetical protein
MHDRINPYLRHLCVLTLVAVPLAVQARGLAPAAGGEELEQSAKHLRSAYTSALQELAVWCESHGLNEEAQRTRACLDPSDPYKLYVAVLPKRVGAASLPPGASAERVEWDSRLTRLRRDQANALYDLARRAARGGRASMAFELTLWAIHANPDHDAIRRLIGQQKLKGQWCSLYEARKLRTGMVNHPKFGWLLPGQVARYEQGQRYSGGKWISAQEDAKLHQDIRTGWDVETEHYTVRTNHSLEAGVALGRKLEKLYELWSQLFVRYYATAEQVIAQFDGRRGSGAELPRHQVVYFRDQHDYNLALGTAYPNIDKTIGAYLQQTRRAYFFAAAKADDRTIYHEATHQLFHESRPIVPDVGRRWNFWIVEGIAMYMESLREQNGFYVLGGFDDERVHAAQYRLLNDNFYVPLSDFTCYGMERLQGDPRVATLYSQAAGLTHFLAFSQNARYRDALVAYLVLVYSGHDEPGTLSRLASASYSDLDRQYRQYMESAPKSP